MFKQVFSPTPYGQKKPKLSYKHNTNSNKVSLLHNKTGTYGNKYIFIVEVISLVHGYRNKLGFHSF